MSSFPRKERARLPPASMTLSCKDAAFISHASTCATSGLPVREASGCSFIGGRWAPAARTSRRYMENRVVLDFARKDAWDLPVLRIACRQNEAELKRAKEQSAALREISDLLRVGLYRLDESAAPPGTAVHECGTARMGDTPDQSVLDPSNQCWDAKDVYVTDASAFPSQGIQNPTLTILALTARACAHALGRDAQLPVKEEFSQPLMPFRA